MKKVSVVLILGVILGIDLPHLSAQDNPDVHFQQANSYYEKQEYSRSLKEIKEALRANPQIKSSDVFRKRYSHNEDIRKLLQEKEKTLATIKGVVKDGEGNPLEEAFVSAGGITVVSDEEGNYQIEGILPGENTVHAWAKGSRFFKKDIYLQEGENDFPVLLSPVPIKKRKREWQILKTMNYVIRHKNEPLAQRVARRLEAHLDRIARDIGLVHHDWRRGKADVTIFKTREEYLEKSEAPRWSGGILRWRPWKVMGEVKIEVEIMTYEGSEEYVKKVFPHEITHAIYIEYTSFCYRIPDWLKEGIAEYEANKAQFWSQEAMETVINSGDYLTFKQLNKNLKGTPSGKQNLYYLESQSVVRFILDRYGWDNFKKFSKKLRRIGVTLSGEYEELGKEELQKFMIQAIRSTFCPGSKKDEVLEDFNKEWTEYVKEKAGEERKARKLLENNQYEEIINQYPKCSYAPQALEKIAERYRFDSKDYSQSIKYYQDLITEYPESELAGNALFTVASIYENNLGEFDKARELYKELIEKYTESDLVPQAYFRLGFVTAVRMQDYVEGASLLKEYVHTFPHGKLADYAQFLLGHCYQTNAEYKRALEEYSELLNKYSKGVWVNNARKEIFSILAEDKTLSSAAELYQEKDYEGSLRELEEFRKKYPLSNYADDALLQIGFIHLYNVLDFKKAGEIFQEILRSYPDWETAPSALYYLAVIENMEGDKEGARSIYKELLEKYPQSIWADNVRSRLKNGKSG